MILVSMCLAGINCNYKGESKPNEKVKELIRRGLALPMCPEQLGGLPTPRSGSRIISGKGEEVIEGRSRVITDNSKDVTSNYLRGAELVLHLCRQFSINIAVLKQGSPSCGKGKTQGGRNQKFSINIAVLKQGSPSCGKGKTQGGRNQRMLVGGNGVTTALLEKNGIKVYSEEDLEREEIWKKLLDD